MTVCAICLLAPVAYGQETPASAEPVRLVKTFSLPATVKGNFDHLCVDLKRNRLFVTPEDFKAVLVLDAASGEVVHQITGIARPHAVFFRQDLDRLYVTDGGDGSLKIYDGDSYKLVSRIPLLKDADSIGYDISTNHLYVDNGGGEVGQSYSLLSEIDTTAGTKLHDLHVGGDTIEAMALDNYRPRIYVNDKATNQVGVVDRFKNSIVAKWPLTMGKVNVAMALDEQRMRLFIGCRSGVIVVLDTNSGKELQMLPIHKGVDDLIFDPASRRLYAATDGSLDVFEQTDLNHYKSLGSVPTGANGRTARLVPELQRIFVAVPLTGTTSARILAFEPVNVPQPKAVAASEKLTVHAPVAEQIILEELSLHPLLRKIGLHVVPPGQEKMVIIANGNETRVGIPTSEGDFRAVKSGATYGPLIADGDFYNMKMPMFDAQGRHIGILVMEIAGTDAVSPEDAARKAESIRSEIEKKIPNVDALFANISSK
jgi:hypothetical protein